jgi:hypothetical protein
MDSLNHASHTLTHQVTEEQGTCMNDDGSVLDGCACHPSCGSCGFHVALYDAFSPCETCDWPATEFDCLTCRDGHIKVNLFDDGTGSCVAPQSATPIPSLSLSLPQSSSSAFWCRWAVMGCPWAWFLSLRWQLRVPS